MLEDTTTPTHAIASALVNPNPSCSLVDKKILFYCIFQLFDLDWLKLLIESSGEHENLVFCPQMHTLLNPDIFFLTLLILLALFLILLVYHCEVAMKSNVLFYLRMELKA